MLAALEHWSGGLWPYLVVIIIGFLPTEIWRVMGVAAGGTLDEDSEIMAWVRFVAAALVAGVVAKLLLTPSGALAAVPLWSRGGALVFGFVVFMAARRSVLTGLTAGVLFLIAAGALFSRAPL